MVFDAEQLPHAASAAYAGLLSPQGKILFDFFAVRTASGFVLDVARAEALALAKRLAMYKLRANVEINDVSDRYQLMALWGPNAISSGPTIDTVAFDDPRAPDLGKRIMAEARFATDIASATNGFKVPAGTYAAHRVVLGVPEGGKDYAFGDAYPHEADFDLFNGVSFSKGCYVGQEIVARMQHKTVVRKRVIKISGASPLTFGADIVLGEAIVGRIGTTDDKRALAMLRLDRAAEAEEKGIALSADGVQIEADAGAMRRYRDAVASKPTAATTL